VGAEYVTAASARLRGGLYIQDVMPNSPASRVDLQKGDILVGLNVGSRHWETIRPDNILYVLEQSASAQAQALQFYIVRRNVIRYGTLAVADLVPTSTLTR
jgi:serine protease Do